MNRPRLLVLAAAAALAVATTALAPGHTLVIGPQVPARVPALPSGPDATHRPDPTPATAPPPPAASTPRDEARRFWLETLAPSTAHAERWPSLKQAAAWELRALGVDPIPVRQGLKRVLALGR